MLFKNDSNYIETKIKKLKSAQNISTRTHVESETNTEKVSAQKPQDPCLPVSLHASYLSGSFGA